MAVNRHIDRFHRAGAHKEHAAMLHGELIADPEMLAVARVEHARLSAEQTASANMMFRRCHVSKTTHHALTEALKRVEEHERSPHD